VTEEPGVSLEQPASPMTELAVNAAQLHELYLAYVAAGFSPDQAMQLLCTMLSASCRPGSA
jgi:hypothetical protein